MAVAEMPLLEVERRKLGVMDEAIRRFEAEQPPVKGGASAERVLRQWEPLLRDFARSAQEVPKALTHIVDSAWDRLHAEALADPNEAGRLLLELFKAEIAMAVRVADLVRIWPRVGRTNPKQLAKKVDAVRPKLLQLARDFRDSWPWPTGQKPDDPEDAAAAQRAIQALPPFDALARLAERSPPPPPWLDDE